MMEPQTLDTERSLRVTKLWLALLLAMFVAALPGPQPTIIQTDQFQHLHASSDALVAIHGRDLSAREDSGQARPLGAATIPPAASSDPPQRNAILVRYHSQYCLGVQTCLVTPCARDPPNLNMTV